MAGAARIKEAPCKSTTLPDGTAVFVTIHPSFLLRIIEHADKEQEYHRFVSDLRPAAEMLARNGGRST